MHLAYAFLPLLAGANAAISILLPRTDSIWYLNNTVALNWTQSDPAVDIYLFRAFLSNEDTGILSTPQGIADSTNASATYVRIALPRLTPARGYIVRLVNTTNETQVFAQSEAFEIQNGEAPRSSSSMLSSQTGTRSTVGLPNASSQGAFPTTSSARPSGGAAPGRVLPVFNVVAQAAGVVAFVGGAAAVLL